MTDTDPQPLAPPPTPDLDMATGLFLAAAATTMPSIHAVLCVLVLVMYDALRPDAIAAFGEVWGRLAHMGASVAMLLGLNALVPWPDLAWGICGLLMVQFGQVLYLGAVWLREGAP